MVSSGTSNATKLAKVWPARKRASRRRPSVSRFVDPPFLPSARFSFLRAYTRGGFRRQLRFRGVTRSCTLRQSFSSRSAGTDRFSIGFQIKWKSRGSRLDLPLRQNGRFHPAISATLSLSLCPFFSSFSGFEIFSRSRNFRRFFRRDVRDIRQV